MGREKCEGYVYSMRLSMSREFKIYQGLHMHIYLGRLVIYEVSKSKLAKWSLCRLQSFLCHLHPVQ